MVHMPVKFGRVLLPFNDYASSKAQRISHSGIGRGPLNKDDL